MKTAYDLARSIIDALASEEQGAPGGDVGERVLAGLRQAMARSDLRGRLLLRDLSRHLYNQASNLDYDIQSNGEAALVRAVCTEGGTVFDVGANRGEWTRTVLEACPGARVHCFELMPPTARELAEAMAGREGVAVNACGLADREGAVTAHYCPERSELSGMYDISAGYARQPVQCKLTTGDRYCERLGIERIRLLKVDCEGAEHAVLQGFAIMLRKRRIDVLQFEYGKANIVARVFLRDLYALLEPHGYRIGKLYPDGVDFRPYTLEDEDFVGPNYVACPTGEADLLSRLSSFRS